VAALSVPEGDDKVAKYPTLFQAVDVVLLTKVDLLGVLDFEVQRVLDDLAQVNTRAELFRLSSKSGEGMEDWLGWLRSRRAALWERGGVS
jgi:hydrogenase nickel incorporation protein HypB